MEPWTSRLPERLAYELAEFRRRGLEFTVDEQQLAEVGRLVLDGSLTVDSGDEPVALTVVFPDSFPYLRPEVYANGITLGRHQNPFEGNLCLLDRSTRAWNTDDTGAWLVAERVPLLLRLLAGSAEEMRANEVPQGEPITSFFPSDGGGAIFVGEEAQRVSAALDSGTLVLAVGSQEAPTVPLRAGLIAVSGRSRETGDWQANADGAFARRFDGQRVQGRWVRLAAVPASRNPQDLLAAAREVSSGAIAPRWQRIRNGEISVLGVVVPEETTQGVIEDAWLFVVRRRQAGRARSEGAYITRGERLSIADQGARVPDAAGLQSRSVSIAGLGTLGAPLAFELARAQVGELHLLDFDTVEAGNIVRWPLGLSAVGYAKTDVIAGVIKHDYPFTKAQGQRFQIGNAWRPRPDFPSEAQVLTNFLTGADLLVDATAEIGVSQLLATLAAEAAIPYLSLWSTEGGWGGAVAYIPPDAAACWFCLQLHLTDRSLAPPPAAPAASVQPRGCPFPTFTGSSFEMLEVVVQAMRILQRALTEDEARSPVAQLYTYAIRDADGSVLSVPRWDGLEVAPHAQCPHCAVDVAA
jgi:hypothetical protein